MHTSLLLINYKGGSDMATPQFKTITDLSMYLEGLERRIVDLENENGRLKDALQKNSLENVNPRSFLRLLPETGLLSRSFLTRAFTVWGHLFVAQLIISGGFLLVYAVVMLVFLGGHLR